MIKRVILFLAAAIPVVAAAQNNTWSQESACPGWNNPTSFSSWIEGSMGSGGYSGSGGIKNNSFCPNVMTGTTGAQSLGPAYTASQMNTVTASECGYPSLAIPDQYKQFAIMTDITGTDPNTANQLRYVPTQFNTFDAGNVVNTNITKSIRIGDGGAYCSASGGGTEHTYDVSLLNYDMRVTPYNAMLNLYYAIVAQTPSHGHGGNPTFIIRVMRKNASGMWQQVNDTLANYISTTLSSNTSNSCPNMDYVQVNSNGWHQVTVSGISSGNSIVYKDWTKASINLYNYLYDTVRVQVLIYDCAAEFHFAYAYIAGECRPMQLSANADNAPGGIATLMAPKDMLNYEWGASEFGVSESVNELNSGGYNSHYTFRTLASGSDTYEVRPSDFQVQYRTLTPGGHDRVEVQDSVALRQTFRCRMSSYFDPDKPYHTNLYMNIDRPATVAPNVAIYADGNDIVVEGAAGNTVTLIDGVGNELEAVVATAGTPVRFEGLAAGTYYVKIGALPARMKVVID